MNNTNFYLDTRKMIENLQRFAENHCKEIGVKNPGNPRGTTVTSPQILRWNEREFTVTFKYS